MTDSSSSRPLLNWLLRRGQDTLAFQVRRTRSRYQVAILPGGENRPALHTTLFRAGRNAFQLHASMVAAFRDAGWTSIAYRDHHSSTRSLGAHGRVSGGAVRARRSQSLLSAAAR